MNQLNIKNIKPNNWYDNLEKELLKIQKPIKNRDNDIYIIELMQEEDNDPNLYDEYCLITNFYEFNNCIEKNEKILNSMINLIPKLTYNKEKNRILLECYKHYLKKCREIFPEYLITNQLYHITSLLPELFQTNDGTQIWYENDYKVVFESPKSLNEKKEDFLCKRINIPKSEVLDLVKKEVKWRKIERDIEIYNYREEGLLLEEIAEKYSNLGFSAVSQIAEKVRGAISYYKGKLFEKKYFQFLKNSKRFDKIEWNGDSGKPDIHAFDLSKNHLYIFSLKNIKIDKKPYWIIKDELKPELFFAYENSLVYDEIFLYLIVFDNLTGIISAFPVDFRNPENIIIKE